MDFSQYELKKIQEGRGGKSKKIKENIDIFLNNKSFEYQNTFDVKSSIENKAGFLLSIMVVYVAFLLTNAIKYNNTDSNYISNLLLNNDCLVLFFSLFSLLYIINIRSIYDVRKNISHMMEKIIVIYYMFMIIFSYILYEEIRYDLIMFQIIINIFIMSSICLYEIFNILNSKEYNFISDEFYTKENLTENKEILKIKLFNEYESLIEKNDKNNELKVLSYKRAFKLIILIIIHTFLLIFL